MTGRRLRAALGGVAAAVALTVALGACGSSGGDQSPKLASLPLVPGANIITRYKQCDHGSNAYCAWELVITDHRYKTSRDLTKSEHLLLTKQGWSAAVADTGEQRAADSPGHKLRVTYSTAYGDLKGVDLGWIERPRQITLSLSRTIFDRASAMSVMLELGAG
jgi:hypothetical protein